MKTKINKKAITNQIFELMKDPQTIYETPWGKINFRKEFIKSILLDIKDVVVDKFDNVEISYMGEGRGKSHFTMQKEYVRWFYLKKLKLIDYDWTLDIVYSSLAKLMRDLVKYMDTPFRQFILDEGDELKKTNWYQPLVRMFFSYLRRGRKFRKFIHINHPNLKEFPEDIVTTRASNTYEIKMKYDLEKLEYIRGHARMCKIPRADVIYSFFHKKALEEMFIKNKISKLFNDKNKKFFVLPKEITCLDINFNSTFPFDEAKYEKKMLLETQEYFKFTQGHSISQVDAKIMNKIFFFLAEKKLVSEVFEDDENARRAYYRLKDNINKIDM